jgi:hypothetical protein
VHGASLFSSFFTLFLKYFFRYPGLMDNEGANRLELRAPLLYTRSPDLAPFKADPGRPAGERLFCFALDETQAKSIEPDPKNFLGPLLAAGRDAGGVGAAETGAAGETLELPRGHYLFAQERDPSGGLPGKDEVITLAIEVQKDGLWERLPLEGRLYLRYLYEDGAMVTQVFRPYRALGPQGFHHVADIVTVGNLLSCLNNKDQ